MQEMTQQENNVFSAFGVQETYEDAVKKQSEEAASKSVDYFKIDGAGEYNLRILPIAPDAQPDGSYKPAERKGYEYPLQSLLLKIKVENDKGEQTFRFVDVVRAKQAGLSVDLIDTYVSALKLKYSNDKALIEAVEKGSFYGGFKWNYQRAMFVLNADNRSEGVKLLKLSYSQYKSLEEVKMTIWKKKLKKNPKQPCPISSIANAHYVTLSKKVENKKSSYSFLIDSESDYEDVALTEKELTELLNSPRIPEVIYRYSNYHLEATIEYLKQFEKEKCINVLDTQEVQNAIQKIRSELPADDNSHFKGNVGEETSTNKSPEEMVNSFYNVVDELDKKNLSEEEFDNEVSPIREKLRDIVDDNQLRVRFTPNMTIRDMLDAVLDAFERAKSNAEQETEVTERRRSRDEEEE